MAEGKTMTHKNIINLLTSLLLLLVLSSMALAIGTTTDITSTVRAPSSATQTYSGNFTDVTSGTAGTNNYGNARTDDPGYIHVVNITENAQTARWKGYVGNVSGELTLADAIGNQLYDWDLSAVSGEIMAVLERGSATGEAPYWSEIVCANDTMLRLLSDAVNHTANNVSFFDDNFYGTWSHDDTYVDFQIANISFDSNQNGSTNMFLVDFNNQSFGATTTNDRDSCPNINLLNSSVQEHSNNIYGTWDEVVLVYYDDDAAPDAGSGCTLANAGSLVLNEAAGAWCQVDFIFVGIMRDGEQGFNAPYDYQMILPDNAGNPTTPTPARVPYTFYMELA